MNFQVIKLSQMMDDRIALGDVGKVVNRKSGVVALMLHDVKIYFFHDEVERVC